jgi:hypothetical protein
VAGRVAAFTFVAMALAAVSNRALAVASVPLDGEDAEKATRRKETELHRAEFAWAKTETPYGTLVKTTEITILPPALGAKPRGAQPEGAQPTTNLMYLCPFALLSHLCELVPAFFKFLQLHVRMPPDLGEALGLSPASRQAGATPARLALYIDEVVPGNVRRPDDGRAYNAVYWTFIDFPAWFLASQHGWFPLCYIPKVVLSNYCTSTSSE